MSVHKRYNFSRQGAKTPGKNINMLFNIVYNFAIFAPWREIVFMDGNQLMKALNDNCLQADNIRFNAFCGLNTVFKGGYQCHPYVVPAGVDARSRP